MTTELEAALVNARRVYGDPHLVDPVTSLRVALRGVLVALSTPPADDVRPWRPEDGDTRCQQCGQPNPIWWADNAQWNVTVGGPDATDDPGGVLCPTCYHAKWLGREARPATPPADDVREALLAVRDEIVRNGGKADAACLATLEIIAARAEFRPHGTVTDAEVEAATGLHPETLRWVATEFWRDEDAPEFMRGYVSTWLRKKAQYVENRGDRS